MFFSVPLICLPTSTTSITLGYHTPSGQHPTPLAAIFQNLASTSSFCFIFHYSLLSPTLCVLYSHHIKLPLTAQTQSLHPCTFAQQSSLLPARLHLNFTLYKHRTRSLSRNLSLPLKHSSFTELPLHVANTFYIDPSLVFPINQPDP